MTETKNASTAKRFLLRGLVQGMGVRPTIARIAATNGIAGSVRNSMRGVEAQVVGQADAVAAFQSGLAIAFPDSQVEAEPVASFDETCCETFRIVDSRHGSEIQTSIPLDVAMCSDCLCDVRTPGDRRYGYAFTTCARCGPRFTILRCMPFDRESTSMSVFPRCNDCEAEYRDPNNRRFHAQTIACPKCGPGCWATDGVGIRIAAGSDAIRIVGQQVAAGKIAAVKGIGGYQLICDATKDDEVQRLRAKKRRPGKPFPVMIRDVAAAEQIAQVGLAERKTLLHPANAIVLLRQLDGSKISTVVSPNLKTIGVMLPTSPLHALLLDSAGVPLVVTSGNIQGSPLAYQNDTAQLQLGDIADLFLHHNRDIITPVDDSVVQCHGNQVTTIRAARGIAPLTLSCSSNRRSSGPLIALGGHQKVAPAIRTGQDLVLTPHVGDMGTELSRMRLQECVECLRSLYQLTVFGTAADCHSDYFTSSLADQLAPRSRRVQHHHAHVAAAMLEHGLLDEAVLGIAFDGTGLGDDKTIWGGEALLATTANYKRVGHLRSFRLPGGKQAIKHPKRISQSLLSQLDNPPSFESGLRYAIANGPVTSSMGRLFDGIAAMLLEIETVQFEGEAAMRLESHCDQAESGAYKFVISEDKPVQFDWRPLVSQVQFDLGRICTKRIAMKFRDVASARKLVQAIRGRVSRKWVLMDVCGGQTHSLVKYGIEQEIADCVELIHGPGCPVCVTSTELIDFAVSACQQPDTIVASFGDMIRVPGSHQSLMQARSRGGNVKIVYSPIDAVTIAKNHPDSQVVFFAVGFETTAPATALAVLQASKLELKNFSIVPAHVRVLPAMKTIMEMQDNPVQGFLAAGHVCSITGFWLYQTFVSQYQVPVVVTGFEPVDLLRGISRCVELLEQGTARVDNRYGRSVCEEGNKAAQNLIDRVYVADDRDWRGFGSISGGGYRLRAEFSCFDAGKRFDHAVRSLPVACLCRGAEVMSGRIKPKQCPAFGTVEDARPSHHSYRHRRE